MADPQPSKRSLGQRLVRQRDCDLITSGEAYMMFINQVDPAAIPSELAALPPSFREELRAYLASLEIGSPTWEQCFLIGALYNFGNVSPEESWLMHQEIAKKNRLTAEALWRYLQGPTTEPKGSEHDF